MNSRLLLTVLVFLVLGADGPKEDETRKDLKTLQGTWAFVAIEEAGGKKTARDLKGMEDRFNWTFMNNELLRNLGMELAKGRFRIDGSKQPKEIDFFDYAGKGKHVRGIYSFEGQQLRIFLGTVQAGDRPKTFGTKPQPGQTSLLLKRHVVQNKDS
jgi:uncharacterized protein (TIGR03067 family)